MSARDEVLAELGDVLDDIRDTLHVTTAEVARPRTTLALVVLAAAGATVLAFAVGFLVGGSL